MFLNISFFCFFQNNLKSIYRTQRHYSGAKSSILNSGETVVEDEVKSSVLNSGETVVEDKANSSILNSGETVVEDKAKSSILNSNVPDCCHQSSQKRLRSRVMEGSPPRKKSYLSGNIFLFLRSQIQVQDCLTFIYFFSFSHFFPFKLDFFLF